MILGSGLSPYHGASNLNGGRAARGPALLGADESRCHDDSLALPGGRRLCDPEGMLSPR